MQASAVFKKSSFYRFGTNLFLIALLGSIVSGAVIYYILPKELPSTYNAALEMLKALVSTLHLRAYVTYIPVLVFISIGVFALSKSMTKRIIVPLEATLEYSKVLGSGDFSKKTALEPDDLPPLVTRLNELVDSYQTRFGTVRDAVAKVEKIQKDIGGYIEKGEQDKIKGSVKELLEITREIDRVLDKIRV